MRKSVYVLYVLLCEFVVWMKSYLPYNVLQIYLCEKYDDSEHQSEMSTSVLCYAKFMTLCSILLSIRI